MDLKTTITKTLIGEKVEVTPSAESKKDILKMAHVHALKQVDKKLKSGGYNSAVDLAAHHQSELYRAMDALHSGKKLK